MPTDIRRAYAIREQKLAYYRKVVNEFEAAEQTGQSAITVEGRLVDYAADNLAKRAMNFEKLDRKGAT
jgi:citrate lyase beta subunit